MSDQLNDDDQDLVRRLEAQRPTYESFVEPFYLDLNLRSLSATDENADALRAGIRLAAATISDGQISQLLAVPEWRGRRTAAWFVGLTRRAQFVDEIGRLLLASELVYAGEGYCLALALIGGATSERHLCEYLHEYLPFRGRWNDQNCAIGALAYLRGAPPAEFLDPALWAEADGRVDPIASIDAFRTLVAYLEQHRMITPPPSTAH